VLDSVAILCPSSRRQAAAEPEQNIVSSNDEFNAAIKAGKKDVNVGDFLFKDHNAFHAAYPPAPGPGPVPKEDMAPPPNNDALNSAIQNDNRYQMSTFGKEKK
jgi:hypothetical protein